MAEPAMPLWPATKMRLPAKWKGTEEAFAIDPVIPSTADRVRIRGLVDLSDSYGLALYRWQAIKGPIKVLRQRSSEADSAYRKVK